ncbi:hypothetical protein [Clostridium sp. D33t1_170424_F3]|uniref:hypothetical protein n=1 Tax=Clostridium sp. D33t1_170424_F3 TaxID=2787099 RepID=UPI0018AC0935|nr:hypothetical protein [Clostridium sp. D33t1_170424_F3]
MKKIAKKTAMLLAALFLMGAVSACGVTVDTVSSEDGTTSNVIVSSNPDPEQPEGGDAVSSEKPKITDADVDDNLDGLCKFLADHGGVSGDAAQMAPEFIGAKAGVQYKFSYEGTNNVVVELYEYDPENLDETAQAVQDNVKKDNTFMVIGQQVTDAYLSDSGKYLMIYKDTQSGEKNELHKKEIVELLQGFKS